MLMGKGVDAVCPIGPDIAMGRDPTSLLPAAFVDGERRQSVGTSDLLFGVADTVSSISQAVALLPGDVILTGAPAGVGPIRPGDVVDGTTEGVGTLTNPVAAER